MGFFGSLGKLVMDTVELPLAVVKDVVTLGGTLTDSDSATIDQVGAMKKDWGDMRDSLDD